MRRIIVLLIALLFLLPSCSKVNEPEKTTEEYSPLSFHFYPPLFNQLYNNEVYTLMIFPSENTMPSHYDYITKIEYFFDSVKIGESTNKPFSIYFTPSASVGQHTLSSKMHLSKNVKWESKSSIIEIRNR